MDFLLPNVAYAAEGIDEFVANVGRLIINPLIILLFSLAAVYFLWGVFQFIANQDSDEERTVGKSHMVYGVIGMSIMMGVFMLMNIILRTFDIDGIKTETNEVQLKDYNPRIP